MRLSIFAERLVVVVKIKLQNDLRLKTLKFEIVVQLVLYVINLGLLQVKLYNFRT